MWSRYLPFPFAHYYPVSDLDRKGKREGGEKNKNKKKDLRGGGEIKRGHGHVKESPRLFPFRLVCEKRGGKRGKNRKSRTEKKKRRHI